MFSSLKLRSAAVIVAVVASLVYNNTLKLKFSFDDATAIVDNRDVRVNETSWFNLLKNDFWGTPMSSVESHKSYRPLTVATFRLNYMLHELEPMGYHLVNVLLHGGVCYLYVLLCGVVFSEVWPALIAGLLFAVHPIHTEAVAGLVGRADVLAGVLFLLSFFCYKNSLSQKATSIVWLILSQLLVMASALGKENGVTAIAVCLLYELIIHQKLNLKSVISMIIFGDSKSDLTTREKLALRKWLRRALVSFFCITTFLYFRLSINQGPPNLSYFNNPAMKFESPYRQLHWSYLCVLNVWLLLSPSQLCAEYAMDTVSPISSLSDPRNLLTLVSSLSLLSLLVYTVRSPGTHQRTTLFGLCLTIVPFLPASNLFFPVGFVIAERVLYLPSMGFCLLISYGFWCTLQKFKNFKISKALLYSAFIYLVLIFSFKTMHRNRDWMDSSSIYRASVKTSPRNTKMLNFLATLVLLPESQLELAEKVYYYTKDIQPQYVSVHRNLGELLRKVGKTNQSIQVLREGANIWMEGEDGKNFYHHSKDIQVVTELAKNLQEYTNNYHEAISLSDYTITKNPRWVTPRRIRAMSLLKLGQIQEAEATIEEALQIKSFSDGLVTKGDIVAEKGDLKEAEVLYRKALRMKSDSVEAKLRVAHVLIETLADEGMFHEAELLLTQVLKSETSSKALYHLCQLHRKGGNRALARNYCNQSLQYNPNAPGPLHALGLFSFEEKDYNESVRLMRHLLSITPDHLSGVVQLATSLMELGENISEAKELFLSVLSKDPRHLQALRHLGILHMRLEELTEAHSVFSRLLTLEPSDAAVARQLEILRKSLHKS